MTIINGANNHSVEDLLSSIRHSIADDHSSLRQGPSSPLNNPALSHPALNHQPGNHPSHNHPMARREQPMPEESAEFELPAIFKPGHHNQHADRPNLFGRLSDALKPAPQPEPDRSRTVIRFEPAAGRMIEPPAVASAQPSRPVEPDDQTVKVAAENNAVARVMPSFFDTRLNRLGEMTRQSSTPKPVEPPQPAPQAVAPQPPPLRPQPPAAEVGASGLEDAAAQLMRPILKQWLMENMPKIVEKALRSEAGDELPPVQTPPERRK